ncbi:uncharacterized protein LOC125668520 isoform X5 [Ostrea edulis]|uniref:uncharacterized protein LOC125668520 isoform X5 n=1 Tax=Ostrea edulis TaxID=37623 RepID=UPI0024AE9A35|nr:uncharacterized protein LOC125668520 isoform X5 [Ostrea edulis]
MATTDFFLHMTAGSRFPPHLTLNLTSLCNGECHRYRLLTTTGSEVIYKEQAVFSSSVQDIVLGVVFSVVALLIVFVTIHYQYKRYRRQRRMQQYLSTPHTDPFERLQDHMEE